MATRRPGGLFHAPGDCEGGVVATTPDPSPPDPPRVVAVFASPVATHLLAFARRLGWRTALVEPDGLRVSEQLRSEADLVVTETGALDLADSDVVACDHDRDELGPVLRDALAQGARWVGVMGNPRHEGPHVAALRGLGVADDDVARVHRPIGLDIGSRRAPEIALSTLAGLVAERAGRSGGFLDVR